MWLGCLIRRIISQLTTMVHVRNGSIPCSNAYEMLSIKDAPIDLISFDDKEVEPFPQIPMESSQEKESEASQQEEVESSQQEEVESSKEEEKEDNFFNVFADAYTKEDSL